MVISYTRIVTSLAVVVGGFLLGLAAERGPALWPLELLLALTIVACLAVTRDPTADRRRAAPVAAKRERQHPPLN